jgi:hypothetical protein
LENEFVTRYELKLVLHTIFTLNCNFVDEEEFTEEQRKRIRDLLCATAESLAMATKSELEIESRLKSEDNAPLETVVAANLQEAAVTVSKRVPAWQPTPGQSRWGSRPLRSNQCPGAFSSRVFSLAYRSANNGQSTHQISQGQKR